MRARLIERRDGWLRTVVWAAVMVTGLLTLILIGLLLLADVLRPGAILAFVSNRDGNSEVYLLDTGSGTLLNLTQHPAEDYNPVWSPDGRRLAFVSNRSSYKGSYGEIFVIDLFGGGLHNLTRNNANDFAPAWSPSGAWIAFASDRDGHPDVYVRATGGPALLRLTDRVDIDYTALNWSPDGSQLAVAASINGQQDIFLLRLDCPRTCWQPLDPHPAGEFAPVWSPDGARLAFVTNRDGDLEVYLVDVTCSGRLASCGLNLRNLSRSPAHDYDPAWSGDGRQLVFVSTRDGNPDLYILTLATGQLQRMVAHPAADSQPVWRPG